MLASMDGDGWKSVQWTIVGAVAIAILTGGVAMWRQFTLMQERVDGLMKLNDTQNVLFETVKDGLRNLQQQAALLAHEDVVMAKELKEQRDFLMDAMTRLRAVEQRMGPPIPPGGKP
jgi:hypothetical protein